MSKRLWRCWKTPDMSNNPHGRHGFTSERLANRLLEYDDLEVGYFDSEGHWCRATAVSVTRVDDADWSPLPHEKQTGDLRFVLEIESGIPRDAAAKEGQQSATSPDCPKQEEKG